MAYCQNDRKNELVDVSAGEALHRFNKEVLGFSQRKSPILLAGVLPEVKSYLTREFKDNLSVTQLSYSICGSNVSDLKLSATFSRTDEVLLHQLRSGECSLMGRYGFTMKIRNSPLCRWCQVLL